MTPKQKNSAFIILILAAVLFYVFSGGSVGVSLDFGEEYLSVSAAKQDWVIPYNQITSLEVVTLPDPGRLLQGTEKGTLCCGDWENDVWGEYTLCIDPRIELCIVVTLQNGNPFVLNYESDAATQQLHQMFTELLQSKGYITQYK